MTIPPPPTTPVTVPPKAPVKSPDRVPSRPQLNRMPNSVPRGVPMPRPAVSPTPIGAVVAAATIDNELGVCRLGVQLGAKKKFPRKDRDSGPNRRKRQRPCKSGKPKVEYVWEKRRRIGSFLLSKTFLGGGVAGKNQVDRRTKITAEEAGYKVEKNASDPPIRITSELAKKLPLDAGWKERVRLRLTPVAAIQNCLYLVYVEERRRKCTCPDGSRCRSTTRK